MVALVTPMHEDGSVDYDMLRALVDWHIAEGTDCIVAVGTTGESATVNVEEHGEVIRVCVAHAAGLTPIMAGAGANSTQEAIELSRHAKRVGASCTLQVVPYYNKPSQEGIYRHFAKIAESVDIPVVLYNVPGRTVADMQHDTVLRLAQVPGIVGIKEATGSIERAGWLLRDVPQTFSVYSGDDSTAVALMLLGGHGNISATPNVAPRLMHELCAAALAGDTRRASELHLKLLPLHRNLFCEPSPAPAKFALSRLRRCPPPPRPPPGGMTQHGPRPRWPSAASPDPAPGSRRARRRRPGEAARATPIPSSATIPGPDTPGLTSTFMHMTTNSLTRLLHPTPLRVA